MSAFFCVKSAEEVAETTAKPKSFLVFAVVSDLLPL